MADATVEITGDEPGEDAAETTAVQAVAETAKSEGAAQESATQAAIAADQVHMDTNQAEQSAQVAAQAMVEAGTAALVAKDSAQQTVASHQALAEQMGQLNQTLSQFLAGQQSTQDVPPATSTVEVAEQEPSKGHWLTRRVGRGK